MIGILIINNNLYIDFEFIMIMRWEEEEEEGEVRMRRGIIKKSYF